MENLLRNIYYDPSSPAGLGSVDKLYRKAREVNPSVKLKDVRKFLKGSRVYTLHKLQRKKFPRRKTVSAAPRIILSCDLADLGALQKENEGVRYLLVCVDVFSRYMYCEPLKRKDGKSMVKAFSKVLEKPEARGYSRIFSDRGKEFYNKQVQSFLSKKKIILYSVYSQETKASVCERAIRTLKHKIYRYLTAHNTLEYLSVLDTLVLTYNNTQHKGLKGKTPSQVHALSDPKAWRKQFKLMYKTQRKEKNAFSSDLQVGDLVRVVSSNRSHIFASGYIIQNTEEIFRIASIHYSLTGLPTYELEDWGGEPIKGIFYRDELIPTSSPETFPIEIIKKRKNRDGTLEYYVHWKSYPERFNEWINASDIQNIADLTPS